MPSSATRTYRLYLPAETCLAADEDVAVGAEGGHLIAAGAPDFVGGELLEELGEVASLESGTAVLDGDLLAADAWR